MKSLRIHDYGANLQLDEIPVPTAGPGQVLVENHATSLNPIDSLRASGVLRQMFALQFPWIPGMDVAGRVAAIGEGVTGFKVGDEVFGYNMAGGAYAEFTVVDATTLAPRDPRIPVEHAAAVPTVGQTAAQMVELAKISHGNTVLIHAGAGGVGSLAIQLARRAGAHVMTTARQSQAAALRELGAERVIDYTRERFEENIKQVDAVLDLVGKDTLARSYALVKPGGFIITANQLPDTAECARLGIHGAFVHVTVTTQRLNTFAALVADGQIKPQIAALQTIWSPATLWAKRDTGRIGKVVFAIRS